MKKTLLFSIFCGFGLYMSAQTKAVTDTGEQVLLYSDGTYKYLNEEEDSLMVIPTNPMAFEKDANASFLLKSERVQAGFWLDPKKWSFTKGVENPDAEYEVSLKGEDLYAVIITEKIEVPLETLRKMAVENAKAIAPDIKIVNQEYRSVNGNRVLFLQLEGAMDGMKISYYGYFYSDETGTVQFITFTAQNLMHEYQPLADELINGFVKV